MSFDTVTTGRAKRSTAGNRMRELLEQAHQDQEKDALFAEEADDDEFEAPQDVRDVYLEEFADTDDEAEDEDGDAQLQKEERRKSKGKSIFNPMVKARPEATAMPSKEALALLDPSIDVSKMAPSTLVLEIRRKRREEKRLHRSENRRSNLRASTLRTEEQLIEKEKQEKAEKAVSRKGRKAQHITGEIRGARPMTQDELIAAALEEEERNKEALTDWLRKEEERRELRRVGRKRVRGPRWTWISRTVGKLVEVVEDVPQASAPPEPSATPAVVGEEVEGAQVAEATPKATGGDAERSTSDVPKPAAPVGAADGASPVEPASAAATEGISAASDAVSTKVAPTDQDNTEDTEGATDPPKPDESKKKAEATADAAPSSADAKSANPAPADPAAVGGPSAPPAIAGADTPVAPAAAAAEPNAEDAEAGPSGPYMRNYLILSQVPGGLPAELRLILGDHVDWSDVKVIPPRNRPLNRKPPIDPTNGQAAKYRHSASMVPYSSRESYAALEAVLAQRYVWAPGGFWAGGEADMAAEGVADIPGWSAACARGWAGGHRIPEVEEQEPESVPEPEPEAVVEEEVPVKGKGKKRAAPRAAPKAKAKAARPAKKARKR